MKLTETEEILINGLLAFGVEKDLVPGIVVMLETEIAQDQMIDYMCNHPQAKQEELLKKAVDISNQNKN